MIRLLLLVVISLLVLLVVAVTVIHPDVIEALTRRGAQRRMDAAQRVGLKDPATWSVTITRHVPQRAPGLGRRVVDTVERRELDR